MHVYTFQVVIAAWLCPVPKSLNLSCLLINYFLTFYWVRDTLFVYGGEYINTDKIFYIISIVHTSTHKILHVIAWMYLISCFLQKAVCRKGLKEKLSKLPNNSRKNEVRNSVYFKSVNMEIYTESKLYFKEVCSTFLQTWKEICIRILF